MRQKIKEYMNQYHMLREGQSVILGLSGGMDSVCLFHLFRELHIPMTAVHVHHGIRKETADRDRDFTKDLCETYGVPWNLYEYDVPYIHQEKHMTLEEAGRYVRREALEKTLILTKSDKIALAHHGDDQAETILFHICRGTGIDGLAGMRPVSGNYIRPLLCMTKEEIRSYVLRNKYDYVEDETNEDASYTRNKIRCQVMPLLTEINDHTCRHVMDMAGQLDIISNFLDEEVKKAGKECVKIENLRILVKEKEYRKYHKAVQMGLLRQSLFDIAGRKKDIDSSHVEKMWQLMDRQTGRQIDLPYGVTARREYQGIVIEKKSQEAIAEEEQVLVDGEGVFYYKGVYFEIKIQEYHKGEMFPTNPYTKWLDYDKIKSGICLRTRKEGDYLVINENHDHKSLQDYYVNEKIPRQDRDQVILLADGSHILWVYGKRISADCRISDQTRRVIKIHGMCKSEFEICRNGG